MEKSIAIQILEVLYRQIDTDAIELPCICFHQQIKNEHLTALSMAIDSLKEELK